jgi:hypothetical protein
MKVIESNPSFISVMPHPKAPEYRRLQRYEKERSFSWSPESVFIPGQSHSLDLFERHAWSTYYPMNMRFAI